MNYKVKIYPQFEREIKRLSKKYRSIKEDYANLLESLKENPMQGADLGKGIRKVRMAISSKGKGKSSGARVITLILVLSDEDMEIGLHFIYDKAERISISDKELLEILKKNGFL